MCFCCLLYLFAFSAALLHRCEYGERERERGRRRGGKAAGVVGGKCLGMQIAECHRDVDARQLPMSSDERLNNEKRRKEREKRVQERVGKRK